jgi:hypothetical protein
MNTKQFAKFTMKEYTKWKAQRDKLGSIPLLPNEPIACFDMGDQTEIVVNVSLNQSFRYIKFVPTAFRLKPINY